MAAAGTDEISAQDLVGGTDSSIILIFLAK